MKKNAVKEFFLSLALRIKSIDKKWYPAIGLGTVAVVSVILVLVFTLTDARSLINGGGADATNPSSAYGANPDAIVGTNENGEEVTYTPEQVSEALDALRDAIKNNKGNIKFKNPFANIKLPTGNGKFTMPSVSKSTTNGNNDKATSTKPGSNTGTTGEKTTNPPSTAASQDSTQEPATATQPQAQE